MTPLELYRKIDSLKTSLEVMRLYQDQITEKIGKRRYNELLNEVLDQYIFYTNLLKNKENEKDDKP